MVIVIIIIIIVIIIIMIIIIIRYLTKKYLNTFLGSDFCTWLIDARCVTCDG